MLLAVLKAKVLETPATAVTARLVGAYGMDAIGKTMLAAALTHKPDIRGRFPDGIFWLTFGQQADLFAK